MIQLTGAQLIIQLLERQGIRTIPGIPGGSNLPLYDALSQSKQIRHILARHEQAAGFMAQGMARVTGTPQVCFATSGPGAMNLLTALADAKLDSIPVIAITGQVPLSMIGTDAFQEVDTYGLSIPITKHNFLVRTAAELLEVIPEAFRIAASGRPGPVLIDVPKDVQTQSLTFEHWPKPGRPHPLPQPLPQKLRQAARLIEASSRPLLLLGGGVIQAQASKAALRLAKKSSLPVATTLMGLGAIRAGHRLSLGLMGMHGSRATNLAVEACDLLIVAGARFSDRTTGKLTHFCPQARILHVDLDPSELNKLKAVHLGIPADIRATLEGLLPLIRSNRRRAWWQQIRQLKRRHPDFRPGREDLHSPYGLIPAAGALLGEQGIVSTDVGQHQMWTAQTFPFSRPRQWLTSGGLGTMGFGLPAAIGASLARPKTPVLCISGDGSLMMNLQEMATVVEEKLDLKLLLLNNQGLGLVRQQQDLFYQKRQFACNYRYATDFLALAKGFGWKTFDLATSRDPQARLAKALSTPGPVFIHAAIDPHAKVYPMVPPGAANKDTIGGETHENE